MGLLWIRFKVLDPRSPLVRTYEALEKAFKRNKAMGEILTRTLTNSYFSH